MSGEDCEWSSLDSFQQTEKEEEFHVSATSVVMVRAEQLFFGSFSVAVRFALRAQLVKIIPGEFVCSLRTPGPSVAAEAVKVAASNLHALPLVLSCERPETLPSPT